MVFNVFRFFVNFAAESYVLAGVTFLMLGAFFSRFKKMQVSFLNVLHLIGLGLATLCIFDDVQTIAGEPYLLSPTWFGYFRFPEYYWITIISFLCPAIAAIILLSKSRRENVIWGMVAMVCLSADQITHWGWSWYLQAIHPYQPDGFTREFFSIEPINILLYLLFAGAFFGFAYYIALKPEAN